MRQYQTTSAPWRASAQRGTSRSFLESVVTWQDSLEGVWGQ